MNDVQLLAHLLDLAGLETTPAREMSHSLLDKHHDLTGVLRLPQEQLLSHPGLGEGAAAFLLLIPALVERYTAAVKTAAPLRGPEDIRQLMAPHFHGQSFERVCAFLTNANAQPFTSVLVGQGGPAAVTFSIRRVLDLALNHGANGVILAHNHPDGIPNFSGTDLVSTAVLAQELALVDIPLLDHYLLAGDRVISLRQLAASCQLRLPLALRRLWFPHYPEDPDLFRMEQEDQQR